MQFITCGFGVSERLFFCVGHYRNGGFGARRRQSSRLIGGHCVGTKQKNKFERAEIDKSVFNRAIVPL